MRKNRKLDVLYLYFTFFYGPNLETWVSYAAARKKKGQAYMEKKAILRNMARDLEPTVFALCLTGMYSVVHGLLIGRSCWGLGERRRLILRGLLL